MTIEYKDSKRIVKLSSDIVDTATFEDDFDYASQSLANTAWIPNNDEAGNRVNISTDKLDFNFTMDSTNETIVHDLTSTSDTKWVLRFKANWSTLTGSGSNQNWFGISDSNQTEGANTTQKGIGFIPIYTTTYQKFITSSPNDQSPIGTNDTASTYAFVANVDLYFTITRTSATVYTVDIRTDSHSGTVVENFGGNQTCNSQTGLRYIKYACNDQASEAGVQQGTIDDVEFYNGVSSLTSKPTDVQDNSILIEKDTAKRYWFDNNKIYSQTAQNTPEALGHTNHLKAAQKINSGHILIGKKVTSCSFLLTKSSNPSGDVVCELLESDGTLIAEIGRTASSGISGSGAVEVEFTGGAGGVVSENDMLAIRMTVPDNSNRFNISHQNTDVDSNSHWVDYISSAWVDVTSKDLYFKATYSTWTMEPTFRDNFSSDNWDPVDSSSIGVTGGSLTFIMKRDGSNDSVVYDLGAGNVSGTAWVLRWKMNFTTAYTATGYSNGNRLWFGLSSLPQTTNQNTAQDSIMMYQNHDGTDSFSASYSNGAVLPQTNTTAPDYATGTDYYCELKRTSSTTIESRMWTGGYDGTLLSNAEDSVSNSDIANITGLQYIKISNMYSSATGSAVSGTIDDIEFYNGVTTLN
jgi:hypothetical protein